MSIILNALQFLSFLPNDSKIYFKQYYENGILKEEGWLKNNKKTDYWYYYYEKGNKKEEGHYFNNKKIKWWIFYDEKQVVLKKSEYKNDELNGLTIIYKKGKIVSAEKYSSGIKIKQWNTLEEFKKDN
ncbi:Protein of unknown function [Flavobacterium indicum GPTSA100-9 = DSM 17447]|uniref:MORN repeat protein n=1 Tax=Flavobacterium indicum (strain DSM 17447 / CIP 109464 / GPTSA100-9) TaxID=1094466 RepID=H8XTQ5_FLAIG|nr:hypothetical protein [Flavobacterium indicum]CCG53635.1 Protein of unknown function [Flavobacterium indicum GPTSA100-9 = DSM 17447]